MKTTRLRWLAPMLALLLITETTPRPVQAQGVATPLCLAIVVLITAAGAVAVINACKPTWRCTLDPETGATDCTTLSRRAITASGLCTGNTNYATRCLCEQVCTLNTNRTGTIGGQSLEPEFNITLERSRDGSNWATIASFVAPLDGWSYSETNAPGTSFFYRGYVSQ